MAAPTPVPPAPPGGDFPWATGFHVAIASFGVALIGPLYAAYVPILLRNVGLAATAVGFFTSLDSYGSLLVLPVVAAFSDRTPMRGGRRKPFMLAGASLAALGFGALPHMHSLPPLVLAILCTVLGMAVLRGPTAALLGDLFPPGWRNRASGVINLMGGLAWVLAFGVGGALYRQNPALPFLVMGGAMFLCVSFVVVTVREARLGGGRAGVETAPSAADRTPETLGVSNPRLWATLRGLAHPARQGLLAALLALLCWVAATFAVGNFFTLYARAILHLDEGTATQMLGLYAGAGVLAAIPAGMVATRFGRRRTIGGGLSVLLVVFGLGYLVSDPWMMAGLLTIGGLAAAAGSVNMLPFVLEAAPTGDVGTYTGLTYLFGAAGGVLGLQITGLLIDFTGTYRAIFLFSPVAMLLALLLLRRARPAGERET